ncbi:MAG: calycin-like domain-containing protein [Lepagella sp.]
MIKALNFFKFAILVSILAVVNVSCGSDDPDEPDPDVPVLPDKPDDGPDLALVKALAGSYKDVMHCSVMSQQFEYADVDVVITPNPNGTINMNIEKFGADPMVVPELELEKVTVVRQDGIAVIQPTHIEDTAYFNGNYLPFTGYVKGSWKDGILTLELSLSFGSMPAMICNYTAAKAEAEL